MLVVLHCIKTTNDSCPESTVCKHGRTQFATLTLLSGQCQMIHVKYTTLEVQRRIERMRRKVVLNTRRKRKITQTQASNQTKSWRRTNRCVVPLSSEGVKLVRSPYSKTCLQADMSTGGRTCVRKHPTTFKLAKQHTAGLCHETSYVAFDDYRIICLKMCVV